METMSLPLPLAIGQLEILLWTLANATPEHKELAYQKIVEHHKALAAALREAERDVYLTISQRYAAGAQGIEMLTWCREQLERVDQAAPKDPS